MLWFNREKGHGFIRTEDDERLYVATEGFVSGQVPTKRCAGQPVTFERATGADGMCAVKVAFESVAEPRRARLRRSR
jgi:cold shock CspA family protein